MENDNFDQFYLKLSTFWPSAQGSVPGVKVISSNVQLCFASVTHPHRRIVSVGFIIMLWTADVWANFNVSRLIFKEWFELERLLKIIQFQPHCHGKRCTFQETKLLRAPSTLALNNSRDGATSASLSNTFHCCAVFF